MKSKLLRKIRAKYYWKFGNGITSVYYHKNKRFFRSSMRTENLVAGMAEDFINYMKVNKWLHAIRERWHTIGPPPPSPARIIKECHMPRK